MHRYNQAVSGMVSGQQLVPVNTSDGRKTWDLYSLGMVDKGTNRVWILVFAKEFSLREGKFFSGMKDRGFQDVRLIREVATVKFYFETGSEEDHRSINEKVAQLVS